MTTLKLDWCSHEAAEYAVTHWHYSHKMPKSKLAKVGVWEDGRFIGAVVFGVGANNNIHKPYGVERTEVCELVRVALDKHASPVSQIVARAIKIIRREFVALRLVVSYADPLEGHHGGIYQAMNWVYVGTSQAQAKVMVNGQIMHKRVANRTFGTIKGLEKSPVLWKHKYVYPLDDAMRKQIAPLAKPYPKRVTRGSGEIDNAPQTNGETGGASPTEPLLLT